MNSELFLKKRVLFVEDFCPYCKLWLEVIERINAHLPIDKRIDVVNCSNWQSTGLADNSLIPIYAKYISGFPILFFEGKMVVGTNSKEECESFLKSLCQYDFIIPMTPEKTFDYDCSFKKTIWGRRIVCE